MNETLKQIVLWVFLLILPTIALLTTILCITGVIKEVYSLYAGAYLLISFIVAIIYVNTKKPDSKLQIAQELLKNSSGLKKEILSCYVNDLELFTKENEFKRATNKKKRQALNESIKKLKTESSCERYDTEANLNEEQTKAYKAVIEAFNKLLNSNKIWIILGEVFTNQLKSAAPLALDRKNITLKSGRFYAVKSSSDVPVLKDESWNNYYIYPNFIIRNSLGMDFDVISISECKIRLSHSRFAEEESVPYDAKEIGHTHRYLNKSGSPDQRFKINPLLPIMDYAKISIEPLNLKYLVSNYRNAVQFSEAFNLLIASVSNQTIAESDLSKIENETEVDMISDGYSFFNNCDTTTEHLMQFATKLSVNKEFSSIFAKEVNMDIDNGSNMEQSPTYKIRWAIITDLIKCYINLGYGTNLREKEGLPLVLAIAKTEENAAINFSNCEYIFEKLRRPTESIISQINNTLGERRNFIIGNVLSKVDESLLQEYLILIYRTASIIAKADGEISETESEFLKSIVSMREEKNKNNRSKVTVVEQIIGEDSNNNPLKELEELVGLNSVKREINTMVNFIKIRKKREEQGMKLPSISYHCVFTGNPGTGKTTVARIVSEIYRELGILKKGHLVETDRSGLVAEYVGQTAVKTNGIIDQALDGVLFIDEAYSLVEGGNNDYGKEAISTLLKRMEDDRDRLIVILAGYSANMQQFIESNPGLKSRFNRYIEFPDYSVSELISIFNKYANRYDYKLTDGAYTLVEKRINDAVKNKDNKFGNGRYIRNIFEKIIENQANRLSHAPSTSIEELSTIVEEDMI